MSATRKPVATEGRGALSEAMIERYSKMAETIPMGGDGTGLESILAQLERADSPEMLASPWESVGGKAVLGHHLEVTTLKRLPSTYAGGLPFFLVVTAVDHTTGELVTFTTGAVSVAAQLVVAHAKGWVPLHCTLVESERETALGYKPQHLRVLADNQPL